MFTNAEVGQDIQFGMNFTLSNPGNKENLALPLTQLIFPATAVGNNRPNQWNIDNHRPGNDPLSLIFANAENGMIRDTPREISRRNQGVKSTKFAVYRVDIQNATVQTQGVQFSYSINTSDPNPVTKFSNLASSIITNEQKNVIAARCTYIKFK